jgi:hypothetical protein
MSKQSTEIQRDAYQNKVLDLEKKYFAIILGVLQSKEFNDDLLLIEKDISQRYREYEGVWNLKNKFKIPAERIVRHYIYTKLNNMICGVYPSPVSSDIGVKTADAIICIDIKTIDTNGNSGDIESTSVEQNQISFDNAEYRVVETRANLKPIDHYSSLPVLTFIVKLIYTDDTTSFFLARGCFPSIVLCCIPNGKLSNLFGKNIVENFKTYNYYTEKDNALFKPIPLTETEKNDHALIETKMTNLGYKKYLAGTKPIYFDPRTRTSWWRVISKNKATVEAVKSGNTMRIDNETLRERFDGNNQPWTGYITLPAQPPLK